VLAVMEALADFGAVNLLNVRAMTDAIYRSGTAPSTAMPRCSSPPSWCR
jgi:ABC-type Fe3+ transport system permease subunit